MAEINEFFFDSYAFFEIIEGNDNYKKYSRDIGIITTNLNLMELHQGLLRKYGKDVADMFFNKYREFCIKIDNETVRRASEFRYRFSKRKLSYIDSIGYMISRKKGIRFLTGDKEFKDLDNVEFVK